MKKRTVLMAMAAATVLVFALVGFSISNADNVSDKDLQLLHVIVRHGIRTPASTYPNDPYKNESFHPTGWGQLTNPGKLELYETGQFLRKRYGEFLGDRYSPDAFYTQSTDVDRTKASVQLINAGLWPPVGDQKWGPLDWQPVPVHSEPLDEDNLLLVRRPCAQYHLEREKVIQSPRIAQMFQNNQHLFNELTQITGMNIKDFDDIQDVYSTLTAEKTFGLQLPEWTKEYYPDKMLDGTIFSYVLNAYNDKMNRLKGGVLLKKLITDWQSKISNTNTKKAYLYGGHDSTIVNILSTLKVWDPQIPNYGIMILMEFSKNKFTQQYGLEIFLRNSTIAEPYQLKIPNCDTFCPINRLIELTKNVIPNNWEEECKSNDPNYVPPTPGGP